MVTLLTEPRVSSHLNNPENEAKKEGEMTNARQTRDEYLAHVARPDEAILQQMDRAVAREEAKVTGHAFMPSSGRLPHLCAASDRKQVCGKRKEDHA